MTGERILIVDDEPRYIRLLRFNLEAAGYRVDSAESGEAALAALAAGVPDLLVLDIMLPGQDGFEICSRIREFSTVPIIMLSARGGPEDRVKGLRVGADDYVVKPFSAQELLARVEAVLRRVRLGEAPGREPSFTHGDLHMDFLTRQVMVRSRQAHLSPWRQVHLSPTEYRLLHCLVENAGKVVTQDALLAEVWGEAYESDVLRVTIRRLRQRIEEHPEEPRIITTVPGVGYLLADSG